MRTLVGSKRIAALIAAALVLGLAAPEAEARFVKARTAAQKVSRLPGVTMARHVGTTKRYYKVTSLERAQAVKLRYVAKNGAIASTSKNLVPRAKQLVALDKGRGGKRGGSTWKDYAFKLDAGQPLLTSSGKNIRIKATNSGIAPVTTEGYLVKATNGLRRGSPARIQADPSDGLRSRR